ncbi:MAG TPA: hypothetical protein VIT43_07025 [Candidatus Dormibacteraeota bacterium]
MNAPAQRGQSVLYAVLCFPVLLLIFAFAIDLGLLQLDNLRLRYALSLATVTAATSVDQTFYSTTGHLRLDPATAIPAARRSLYENLAGLQEAIDANTLAANAEITIINQVPARDPFTGSILDRPAICARLRVPHRFAMLGWIGLSQVETTITADAEIRT